MFLGENVFVFRTPNTTRIYHTLIALVFILTYLSKWALLIATRPKLGPNHRHDDVRYMRPLAMCIVYMYVGGQQQHVKIEVVLAPHIRVNTLSLVIQNNITHLIHILWPWCLIHCTYCGNGFAKILCLKSGTDIYYH